MKSVTALLRLFFYKQKTAYEVRISDWSSDVCSSDLDSAAKTDLAGAAGAWRWSGIQILPGDEPAPRNAGGLLVNWMNIDGAHEEEFNDWYDTEHVRSEEHTSELQSLMRISYAVFCLKTKNGITHYLTPIPNTTTHYPPHSQKPQYTND